MLATKANMRAILADYNRMFGPSSRHVAVPGVFAYSRHTKEECSASPGDYWMMGDNECLKDEHGNDMVLMRRNVILEPIR